MKAFLLLVLVTSLNAACTPTGLRAPAEPYEEFAFKGKPLSVDETTVAMVDCGYLPEWGFGGKPEPDYVLRMTGKISRLECMFQKGFYLKDGWGGYCSVPEYRVKLQTVCESIPVRPQLGYYGDGN